MGRGRAAWLAALLVLAGPGQALDLPLPEGAEQTAKVVRPADTVHLPQGGLEGDTVPRLRLDGTITSRAWRVRDLAQGTLARMAPLRAALEQEGWQVVFACAAEGCGGFGFRFAVPVLPAPAMFVNLFDYRYLLARRGAGEGAEHVMLFVSRAGGRGYVQITHVGVAETAEDGRPGARAPEAASAAGSLGPVLREAGRFVLRGLDFASGEAVLGPGPHADLAALAAFLSAEPEARIALVGHTDNVGALDANIALSQARAEAVRDRLIADHGVEGARVEARGVGYLAPVAANDTQEGRETNRRVEAVLLQ
ncbi:OmpA family protein [Roseovarius ramblicola]|uniref:OmpA family protein n=1 Tax=Roseovarius ramblicola TaxID=2022336 RepID=A0ABV5HZY1_9RHOB